MLRFRACGSGSGSGGLAPKHIFMDRECRGFVPIGSGFHNPTPIAPRSHLAAAGRMGMGVSERSNARTDSLCLSAECGLSSTTKLLSPANWRIGGKQRPTMQKSMLVFHKTTRCRKKRRYICIYQERQALSPLMYQEDDVRRLDEVLACHLQTSVKEHMNPNVWVDQEPRCLSTKQLIKHERFATKQPPKTREKTR